MPRSMEGAGSCPFTEAHPFYMWRVAGHGPLERLDLMKELTGSGYIFVTETVRKDSYDAPEAFWIFKKGAS